MAADTLAPSGAQWDIGVGENHAVVVEVGGGIRSFVWAGRDVLDGYGADEMCSAGRGQLLLPWPNRIRGGRYTFSDEVQQLAVTEPAKNTAIHGLTRWSPWRRTGGDSRSLTVECILHPQPGYPHTLRLQTHYWLDPDGLTVSLTAENLGTRPAPFGAGAHPYLTCGSSVINECDLQMRAGTWLRGDQQQIPVGEEMVAGTALDFSAPRPIGTTVLDTAFAELERDVDGKARVVLSAPNGGRRVTVWLGPEYRYLMLFTGDTIKDSARRRTGLGVEPMTCAPDAFNSGRGLIVLEPGGQWKGQWGISVEDPRG